ncbi:hypothetical protein [Nocardia sp. NPDC020380]|uniref:hypothetical protein n=1 Tax=Nocardia sp. NPDC020380 TaxID=3364309 RepID=UPI00379E3580
MPPTSYSRIRVVFGSVLLNHAGRLAEQAVLNSLAWPPGTPIDIELALPGVLVVTGAADGAYAIARNGQLPIPAPLRRQARLPIGHRVLLAAHPDQNRLIIVCQIALDALVTDLRTVIDGGETR